MAGTSLGVSLRTEALRAAANFVLVDHLHPIAGIVVDGLGLLEPGG
jgi:hypothetical protein